MNGRLTATALAMVFLCACSTTPAVNRAGICDTAFYGRYQDYTHPKAMVFAVQNEAFGSFELVLPEGEGCFVFFSNTGKASMRSVAEAALVDCNTTVRGNNTPEVAAQFSCLVAARNDQWEPWVTEMKNAWIRREEGPEQAALAYQSAIDGAHQQQARLLASAGTATAVLPALPTPPPTGSINDGNTKATIEHGTTRYHFKDSFDWCRQASDSCNADRIVEIIQPGSGTLVGRLALHIRPRQADAAQALLDYSVQLYNGSHCALVIEQAGAGPAGEPLPGWSEADILLAPGEYQARTQQTAFAENQSARARISIRGYAHECVF